MVSYRYHRKSHGFLSLDEEYTLKSLDEVPQTGNSEYLKAERRKDVSDLSLSLYIVMYIFICIYI
jgi:hypothetical protein